MLFYQFSLSHNLFIRPIVLKNFFNSLLSMTLLLKHAKELPAIALKERTRAELLDFGLLILDKPSGPTSHDTVSTVKQILGVKKAGHSGTLDPKVTGVLPIALGRATRFLSYLLKSPKEYVCLMRLHAEVS